MNIKFISSKNELESVCDQISPELWGEDNDMSSYNPDKLKKFLDNNGVLILAYEAARIVGIALCYELPHPSGEDTFYVHELDTHPDFRRQGIGKKLMQEVIKYARQKDYYEAWVATEIDNLPANKLYKRLNPTEIEPSVTYSYKIK